jgi:hypothetical protein
MTCDLEHILPKIFVFAKIFAKVFFTKIFMKMCGRQAQMHAVSGKIFCMCKNVNSFRGKDKSKCWRQLEKIFSFG